MHGSSQRIAKMTGYNNRMPNTDLGECLFVKTHKCAMLTNGGDVSFQRALVLYRKPSDNLQANLRYLTKLNNRLKGQGKRMLSESCSEEIVTTFKIMESGRTIILLTIICLSNYIMLHTKGSTVLRSNIRYQR